MYHTNCRWMKSTTGQSFLVSLEGTSDFSEDLWWPVARIRTTAAKFVSAKTCRKSTKNAWQDCKIRRLIKEQERCQVNCVLLERVVINWQRWQVQFSQGYLAVWSEQSIFLHTTILQDKTFQCVVWWSRPTVLGRRLLRDARLSQNDEQRRVIYTAMRFGQICISILLSLWIMWWEITFGHCSGLIWIQRKKQQHITEEWLELTQNGKIVKLTGDHISSWSQLKQWLDLPRVCLSLRSEPALEKAERFPCLTGVVREN